MAEIDQSKIAEFERGRAQMFGISQQKQQLQIQSMALKQALEELEKTPALEKEAEEIPEP